MRILEVQNIMQRLPQNLIYLKHQSMIGPKNTAKNASTQLIIKIIIKATLITLVK